jgi:uncharacterized membrane protein
MSSVANPVPNIPETQKLASMATHLLEECRMVLPGIQALFGFQLIAVFNQSFWDKLSEAHRFIHFIALAVIAVAIALVMTPAAYHRLTQLDTISRRFIIVSARLLLVSMFPLLLGISLDFYIIADLILQNDPLSVTVALSLFVLYVTLWFVLPILSRHHRHRPF